MAHYLTKIAKEIGAGEGAPDRMFDEQAHGVRSVGVSVFHHISYGTSFVRSSCLPRATLSNKYAEIIWHIDAEIDELSWDLGGRKACAWYNGHDKVIYTYTSKLIKIICLY